MQRPNYQLKTYIKAVELLYKKKGFSALDYREGRKGSAYHFELFRSGEIEPHTVWQVHTDHTKKRIITSREDYRKAARNLMITEEEFMDTLKNLK